MGFSCVFGGICAYFSKFFAKILLRSASSYGNYLRDMVKYYVYVYAHSEKEQSI